MAKPQSNATEQMLSFWRRLESKLIAFTLLLWRLALRMRGAGTARVHPHFYAAYVSDTDGHKGVIVCHRVDGYCDA